MIRKMSEKDADAVYRLMCRVLDQHFEPEVILYFMMQWPRGQYVSCDLFGNIDGFITGSRLSSGRVSVTLLGVDPRKRRTGIGSALLRSMRQAAAMEGFHTVQLEVRSDNTAVIEFYKRRGFSETERMPAYYTDGSDGLRMVSSVYYDCRNCSVEHLIVHDGLILQIIIGFGLLSPGYIFGDTALIRSVPFAYTVLHRS